MPDINLAVGDGVRRMTYAELAQARGISVSAARRLTLRHRWHKQMGNDGLVVVSVPLPALEKLRKSATIIDATSRRTVIFDDAVSDTARDATSDTVPDTVRESAIRAMEGAVAALTTQLAVANERADHAEQRAKRAEQRADQAEQRVEAERKWTDIARDEAAELRAELEARRSWGLGRRLRWALGRKR